MRSALLVFTLIIYSNISVAQLSSGLIGHWNFNGNANDVSGNGNHGTPSNITYTAGKIGSANTAARFNGTNSVITVPYNSQMNLTKLSICAMVRVDGYNQGPCQGDYILSRSTDHTSAYYALMFSDNPFDGVDCNKLDTSKHVFLSGMNNSLTKTGVIPAYKYTPTIVSSKWYCVVSTYENGVNKIYVDGNLMVTNSFSLSSIGTSSDGISIGASTFNPVTYRYWLNGALDDVRLYNRVLSSSEVAQYCSFFDTAVYISQGFNDTLFCEDDTVSLQYGVTNNFKTNNTFTVQMSDASGSFIAPLNIGSITASTAGTITCNIPNGLVPSSNYRVRVVASNPVSISDVSSPITIQPTLTPSLSLTATPSGVVAFNTPITFNAVPTDAGSNPSYKWFRNGIVIPNNTSDTWTINTLNNNDTVWAVVYSSNMCPPDLSANSNNQIVQITTSVNNIDLEQLALYPNPNKGNFTVFASAVNYKVVSIDVLNTLGQIVHKQTAEPNNGVLNTNIQLTNVASGMYLLRITANNKQRNIRFIVE